MQDRQASDFNTLRQYAERYLRRSLIHHEEMQLQEFAVSFLPPPVPPADDDPQRLQDKIAQMMHMIMHCPEGLSRSNWTPKTDVRKTETDALREFLRSGRLPPRPNARDGDT